MHPKFKLIIYRNNNLNNKIKMNNYNNNNPIKIFKLKIF